MCKLHTSQTLLRDAGIQSAKSLLAFETQVFSDFPWAPSADEFPSASAVRRYLHSYADMFQLHPHIRLGCSVAARRSSDGLWMIEHHQSDVDTDGGATRLNSPLDLVGHHFPCGPFDRLIIASGIFDHPRLPHIPGVHPLHHLSCVLTSLRPSLASRNTPIRACLLALTRRRGLTSTSHSLQAVPQRATSLPSH